MSQYHDWKSSLHHQTLGPGILWQLDIMSQSAGNSCLRCHAPLAEQKALIAHEFHWPNVPRFPPPSYVPIDLAHQGLVCAACHVRGQRRYGPPPPSNWPAGDTPGLPHDGFIPSVAFRDSRFCATCHQFKPGGPKLDGTLLENTYNEWRSSKFSRHGVTCQSCHMPGGRHLWRGIHDPKMVRNALHIVLRVRRLSTNSAHATAQLVNVGAGHDFPTYLVPRVTVYLELLGKDNNVVRPLASREINRYVNVKLTHEYADTRLPPGGKLALGSDFKVQKNAELRVRLRIVVDPEEWYIRMYHNMLARSSELPPASVRLLRQALQKAVSESFQPYQASVAVPGVGKPVAVVAN